MTLLVLCDHDRGALPDSVFEALTFAKSIADETNTSIQAVLIGQGSEEAVESVLSLVLRQ